jgi:hypothetical protein
MDETQRGSNLQRIVTLNNAAHQITQAKEIRHPNVAGVMIEIVGPAAL